MVRVSIYDIATHSMTDTAVLYSVFNVGMATFAILMSRADIVAPIRTLIRINHCQVGRPGKYG